MLHILRPDLFPKTLKMWRHLKHLVAIYVILCKPIPIMKTFDCHYETHHIVFLCGRPHVGWLVDEWYSGNYTSNEVLPVHCDHCHLGYLPELNAQANEYHYNDHGIGLIVQDVQEDNEGLEDVEEHGADRQPLQGLAATPELHICQQVSKRKREWLCSR